MTAEPRHYPHAPVRPEWLAQHAEPALEPDLPIVDAHHHLWEMHGSRYKLDEFLADTRSGHDIRASVFIQCGWSYRETGPEELRPLGETEAVVAIAEEAERRGLPIRVAAGIVGFADLTLGTRVEPVLAAQIEAGRGRLRGTRHTTARHEDFIASLAPRPPAGLMGTAAIRDGAACLAKLGLRFDAWLYHHQLDELIALASALPHLPIAVNHLGGPIGIGPYEGRRDAAFAEWRAAILRLARFPNVVMKLGGLGMRVSGFAFQDRPAPPSSAELAEAWRPYIETAIEAFGPTRCLFESNFPVDKGMFAYGTCWNAFKRLAAGASAEEKTALFSGTATRFYAL